MARIPLMLGLRLRLAPSWLIAQYRCRPASFATLAVITPVLLALLLAVILLPDMPVHLPRICPHGAVITPGQSVARC